MLGIPREVAEHTLNVKPGSRPVKQCLRRFDEEKRKAIGEEIAKLLAAGLIKEVQHPEWLANPVLIKKKNRKWRMCVDYTNLNKACPKDAFPLPRIDQVVDLTAGSESLCFLDAYSGYHQIGVEESDQPATAFITPFGCFCYVKMPFGLKNAGATYQRCMQSCLREQIGRNLEVYVDDIVVKSKSTGDLIANLEETFSNLRRFNIKLNPEKCVFGVPKGKLLGFNISERGIEANPEKISAIMSMGPIHDVKGVQRLTGCLAALSRFISRLGERGMPLYKLLKRAEPFQWTDEAQDALDKLKALLTNPPVLASPEPNEPLLLYVAATGQAVSAALVVEREEPGHALKVQRPVYFVSKVLTDCESRYSHVQKLLYAVLISKRKLLHYFGSHHIAVVASHGLGDIINNQAASGKIAKWALELMGFDISYVPRTAIKSQALADFVAEWTDVQVAPVPSAAEHWTMYFDSSLTVRGAGSGVVLVSPTGDRLKYALRLHFKATNNVAEYEALINGLRIAADLGVQ